MKKYILLFALVGALVSCNNSSETAEEKADSIEERKDTLLDKVDSTADAKIDSVKQWSEKQEEKIDSAAKARKDSVKGNS
jgi:hypothetical protein